MREVDLNATLYDMNKQLSSKECVMTEGDLGNKRKEILNWFKKHGSVYSMLLCNDRRDYTVFRLTHPDSPKIATDELIVCLKERGYIISIEPTAAKDAYEIWLRIDGEDFCYYLFNYSSAVIEC